MQNLAICARRRLWLLHAGPGAVPLPTQPDEIPDNNPEDEIVRGKQSPLPTFAVTRKQLTRLFDSEPPGGTVQVVSTHQQWFAG